MVAFAKAMVISCMRYKATIAFDKRLVNQAKMLHEALCKQDTTYLCIAETVIKKSRLVSPETAHLQGRNSTPLRYRTTHDILSRQQRCLKKLLATLFIQNDVSKLVPLQS